MIVHRCIMRRASVVGSTSGRTSTNSSVLYTCETTQSAVVLASAFLADDATVALFTTADDKAFEPLESRTRIMMVGVYCTAPVGCVMSTDTVTDAVVPAGL